MIYGLRELSKNDIYAVGKFGRALKNHAVQHKEWLDEADEGKTLGEALDGKVLEEAIYQTVRVQLELTDLLHDSKMHQKSLTRGWE